MKQKKRSGFSRIGAMLLVLVLAVNLIVPCFAAGGVVFDDSKTIDTGILTYDYDNIPKHMLEDNYALDALEYIGYDVQALKDNKVLYHQDYIGRHLASNQYLLQEDPILTYIPYRDNGVYGSASTKDENGKTVPDVQAFYKGKGDKKAGMSCTSFVEYFVFGYLKLIVGKDTRYIENMHAIAQERLANGTRTYPDTWTEMCEGKNGLISQGKVKHYSVELDDSKEQTDKYNAIWRDIGPGTIIRFGNDNSEYLHYAVYIGTYNNLHYVAHVAGGDRGPEIFIAEHMAYRNDEKTSFPIDFYDFKFQDPYGAIQVVKADADDDTKLAGAEFVAINIETGLDYTIGPTNEKGYAIFEELPYGTYTVRETVAPQGYALSDKTWTVVLKEGNSLETLYHEIVNKKAYGSLQIQKDTNTGKDKAGWQFNVYKNSPSYTTQLTLENSGQMFRVTVSDSSGNSVTSSAVTMTTTPLKILKQPQSVKVALGDTARFNVTVQGDGLEYKWYYQNPGGEVNEAGSTAGMYTPYYNYTISNAARSGRAMWCVITDKYGNSVTSDKAYLWVNTDPNAPSTIEAAASLITYGDAETDNAVTVAADTLAITQQPQDHIDEDGTFATFTVEAQGVGLTYIWETSTDGGRTWTRLTNPVNNTPYTTDAQGIVNISNLQTGDYFVQEIDTGKDGWEYDLTAKPVTVTANHTAAAPAVVRFTNNELSGSVFIDKFLDNPDHLAGWKFSLYADADCTILVAGPKETNEDGFHLFDGLTPGTYWVREEGHIDPAIEAMYYCASENPQMVTVEAGRETYVEFENELLGTIEIIKKGNNGELLSGAVFTAVDHNGKAYPFVESLESPGHYFLTDVPFGTYTVTEVTPPPGYEIGEQDTWTVTLSNSSTDRKEVLTIINDEILGGLTIKKETEDGKNLAGWIFNVYADENCSALLAGNLQTNADGFITYSGLKPGTVWVKEVGHTNSDIADLYYCNSTNPQSVEIVGHETATVTFENKLRRGSLEISKDTNTGTDRDGWKVNVYFGTVAEENLLPGSPFTTDENGKIVITDLLIGTYIAVEVDDGKEMWIYDLEEKAATVPHNGTGYITITNIQQGYGEIQKDTTNGGTKEGWMFLVKDADGNEIPGSPFTTGANGKIDLGLLLPGDYTVQEIGHSSMTAEQLAYWTQATEPQTLTIEAGTTKAVTFVNQWSGMGTIVKTTVNGGSVASWQFKVWTDTAEIGIFTTNENGEFNLGLLAPGTYYVQEVGHESYDLRYWIMDSQVKELTIVAGQTATVSFENVWMGELVIDKQAVNSDLLAGWTGDLYLVNPDGTETKIGTYTSDENGIFAELLVAPGKYIFRETGHTDSSVELKYWVMADAMEMDVSAGSTTTATIINTQLGNGQIQKDTTNGGIKAGWQFNVWSDGMETITVTTNENGEYNLGLLAPGTYYVQEIGHISMTAEQLAYWIMDSQIKELTIVAGQTSSVSFENQWLGYGQIKKEMPDGGTFSGWIFDVYRISDNAYIGEFTSDENGDIALGYLLPGDYRVIERVPDGSLYQPVGGNEKILTVIAGEVSSLTVRNTLKSGEVKLNKVDTSTDKALAGAKFLLEWLDGDVWKPVILSDTIIPGGCRSEGLVNGCLVTDAHGQAIFEGLHPDCEYRLTEVEAPDGYMLQAAPVFEGKLPADTLSKEVTAYNSGIYDVPETGVNDHLEELILFTAFVVILFFVMVALAAKEGLLTEIIRGNKK